MSTKPRIASSGQESDSVLCCLVRTRIPGNRVGFLVVKKNKKWTFPVTKFRQGEDLYSALERLMEKDLGLPKKSYFPEEELKVITSQGGGPIYPGLAGQWNIFPVDVSVTEEAVKELNRVIKEQASNKKTKLCWMTVNKVQREAEEDTDVYRLATEIMTHYGELLESSHDKPSMDALANYWAAENEGGARVLRSDDINSILESGSRAFNLRVADPYLPYQRQGLGFTWSFFTPKDKQDTHVHGLPQVEIFGVFDGRLNVFYKHMTQRGAAAWRSLTLEAGDWLEIEPLVCHFSYWLDLEGTGTVFKAAASGNLGGVGKLGMFGKTTCEACPVRLQCARPPVMVELERIHQMGFAERDYKEISAIFKQYEEKPGTDRTG